MAMRNSPSGLIKAVKSVTIYGYLRYSPALFSGSPFCLVIFKKITDCSVSPQGRIKGEGAGGAHPPPPPRDDLRFSNTTGILQKKKKKLCGLFVLK